MKKFKTEYITITLEEYKELLYVYAEYQTWLAYQRQLTETEKVKTKNKIGFEYKKGETSP